ncbi:polyketide antibiotic transporter [Pseudonocardia parietis]|uniref:ABC-2 type transport system permease protein n=1 Tax=Pseudonocardia parietis TaxID=570936 RepID=A0ABS4VVT9_9PSEU|nr:polyketide antibiotic transporter [Pseudonocardia parietis]MBP2368035.1 ABC-2 type transport system permease protein [Pseudonocardia parietis]
MTGAGPARPQGDRRGSLSTVRPGAPADGTEPTGGRAPAAAGAPAPRPTAAVARLTTRWVRRSAAVVALVAAGMSAIVVASYDSVVAQAPGGAAALQVLATNPAIRTLFGEPVALDDSGGFTVWRTGTALGVLLGVWALLTATRLLRGEEDAGRWTLLLAGRLRHGPAVATALAVLTAALLTAGGAVAVAMILAGANAGPALLHAAGLALTGAFFAGVGAVAAQVAGSRGAASGAGTGVLLGMLLLRMIGDGVDALGWLRWFSPFGLTALAAPFHTDRVAPVLVLAAAAVGALVAAPLLAARRDVGDGLVPRAGTRRARLALLGSPHGFALRRTLRPLTGWAIGVGAFYLLLGLLAVSLTDFLQRNPLFAGLATRAGFGDLATPPGFAGTLFALLPVPVGAFAAVRIAALAHDETTRRLGLLLAAPLSRVRLLTGTAAVTAGAAVALTLVAAVAMWAGAAATGADLGLGDAVAGAANTLPISLLGLGFAVLGLGLSPRAVIALGILPGAGGFLLNVLADSIDAPRWVAQVSPFAHLEPVPATAPTPAASAVMLAVALLAAAGGVLAYRRRDLRSD